MDELEGYTRIREGLNEIEAMVLAGLLDFCDIEYILDKSHQAGWPMPYLNYLGKGIYLYVKDEEAQAAREALEAYSFPAEPE